VNDEGNLVCDLVPPGEYSISMASFDDMQALASKDD